MTSKNLRRFLVATTACLVLAAQGALAVDALRVTQPVQATKDNLDPQRTYSAPYLAVNPSDETLVVASFHEFRTKKCGIMRSSDGGTTWTIVDSDPSLPDYPFCVSNNSNTFQNPIAWGSDNTLYMALPAWDTADTRTRVSVAVARSTDLGDTWTTTLVRNARPLTEEAAESNRPVTEIVVDTSGAQDVVYVAARMGYTNRSPGNASVARLFVSTDGARTFGEPINISDLYWTDAGQRAAARESASDVVEGSSDAVDIDSPRQYGGGNPAVTVDDSGNAYVAWKTAYSQLTPAPPTAIVVSKTSDQGQTWTHTQVRAYDTVNGSGFVIPFIGWTAEGGSQGTLHMATAGTKIPDVNSSGTIFYLQSTDGGATWSEQIELPQDPDQYNGKFIPFLDVAPNGRVDVVWWDTRDDPGIRANDVYYTYSTDNGSTWAPEIRVTDQIIDRRFGVWGVNFDQNSPPSVASASAYALFAWDDTRFSRGGDGVVLADNPADTVGVGGGVQDVMVAAVQFSEIGGGSSSLAKGVLAGVIGLAVVGIVLLGVSMAGRSGSGSRPADA